MSAGWKGEQQAYIFYARLYECQTNFWNRTYLSWYCRSYLRGSNVRQYVWCKPRYSWAHYLRHTWNNIFCIGGESHPHGERRSLRL